MTVRQRDDFDRMPREWRDLANELGSDVVAAWKRKWTIEQVRRAARDGRFEISKVKR